MKRRDAVAVAAVAAAFGAAVLLPSSKTTVATTTVAAQGVPVAAAGTCVVGPLPDRACTPGALNPDVTQATIGKTICVAGWTKTVRPPASVTGREKLESMRQYGVKGPSGFEYDHLISLELGGAPNDPRNLWPEPHDARVDGRQYGSFVKDKVENALKRAICREVLSLSAAQEIVAVNWTRGLGYAHVDLSVLPESR